MSARSVLQRRMRARSKGQPYNVDAMLESFTSHTFRKLIGQTFYFDAGGADSMKTQLADVVERQGFADSTPPAGSARLPFSILFLGPPEPAWPQRTYRVTNQELGTFDLFIVPLGPEGHAMRYEAVFG